MRSIATSNGVRAVLLGALVAMSACGDPPAPEAPVARPVRIFEVSAGGGGTLREFPGEIKASQNTDIAFEVAGKIIEFPVLESQRVGRGDVLAKLDGRDFQASLSAAEASTRAAKADLERYQALFKESVASKQQLEKAERNYEVFVAREQTARKALEDTVLRAPYDGVVARKLVDDFANVEAKQPVVTLQTGANLEVVVNIPEQDYARIRPGSTVADINRRIEASVVASALPDRAFPAKLKEFATTADPVTRTFAATFSFSAPDDVNVMPGMTAKVRGIGAPGGGVEGTLVPVQAVAEDEGAKPYVWVVDPSSMQVRKVFVTLGELTGSSVQVRSGLSGGDWVVTSGVHQLREGMEVRRLET